MAGIHLPSLSLHLSGSPMHIWSRIILYCGIYCPMYQKMFSNIPEMPVVTPSVSAAIAKSPTGDKVTLG